MYPFCFPLVSSVYAYFYRLQTSPFSFFVLFFALARDLELKCDEQTNSHFIQIISTCVPGFSNQELDELAAQLTNLGSASPDQTRVVTNNSVNGKSPIQAYINGQHQVNSKPDSLSPSSSSGIQMNRQRDRNNLSDHEDKSRRSTSASSTGSSSSSSSDSISSQYSSGSIEHQSAKGKVLVGSSSSASGSRSTGSRDFRSSTCSSASTGSSNESRSSKNRRRQRSPIPASDQRRLTVVENVPGHEYDAVGGTSGTGDENGWCDDDGDDEPMENTETPGEKHPAVENNAEAEDGEGDLHGEDEEDDDDGEVDVVEEGEIGPDLEETAQIRATLSVVRRCTQPEVAGLGGTPTFVGDADDGTSPVIRRNHEEAL